MLIDRNSLDYKEYLAKIKRHLNATYVVYIYPATARRVNNNTIAFIHEEGLIESLDACKLSDYNAKLYKRYREANNG